MRHCSILRLFPLLAAACTAPVNGLLVSPEAEPVGGNLFIERLDDGARVLVLDGEITPETSFHFQALLEYAEPRALVIAQSPGGNLPASHQIGMSLAARRMNTVILVSCWSACVDVFIAGRERSIAEDAEIGLHGSNLREFGYFIDSRYWGRFGFGDVNELAYEVPEGELWIVGAEQAAELNLATEILR